MRDRVELALEGDPLSLLDREDIQQAVARLRASLRPSAWALLELLALEVCRVAAVDLETRRQLLQLPHGTRL